MKPHKIAIVVGFFPTISETFIVNQVNALLDAGHEVSLYSYKKQKLVENHSSYNRYDLLKKVNYFHPFPERKVKRVFYFFNWLITKKGISIKRVFKSINVFKYGALASSFKLFYEMQWFMQTQEFDIVHAHFGHNAKRIAYIKALGFLENSKLVATFHGYDLVPHNESFYKEEYKYLLTQCNAFTVNTPYLKHLVESLQPKCPISILPVGLDTSFFNNDFKKATTSVFTIVFCGRFVPLKGPNIAIDILKELHNRGLTQIRLHLIGDGELLSNLKVQVSELKLNAFIHFYGEVSQDKIKEIFGHADVFLLPGICDPVSYKAETQGLVIQEAQAMGLPVVVSDVGGMKYGLLDGETGFVVHAGDIVAFADVIERLIVNPDLKKSMGAKGKTFVKENYDNNTLLGQLLELYNQVLQ